MRGRCGASRATAPSNSARTHRSVGAKPKSGVTATRRLDRSRGAGVAKPDGSQGVRPSTTVVCGSFPSGRAMTDSRSPASATSRAIGPPVDSASAAMPRVGPGTTPALGRKPTTPQ